MSKKKIEKIIIIGAGGFGREVLWTLLDCNKKSKQYEFLGFVDDDKSLKNQKVNGYPILGNIKWLLETDQKELGCVVAIGDNKIRKKIVNKLKKSKFNFPNIIHPSVICSNFVTMGHGNVIQHNSIISMDVIIGNHVYINFGCVVGHDCKINDFVTLSHGVNISGNNMIGEDVNVGVGTATKQRIKIGKGSFIGGGTILSKNIPDNSIFYGPSGKWKKFE